MKVYTLLSPEQLEAKFKAQERKRNDFELGDTVPKLIEFFASRQPEGGQLGEGKGASVVVDNAPWVNE